MRMAAAMFSVTTSWTPNAASRRDRPSGPATCSSQCKWIFDLNPKIYSGCVNWWEPWHGMDLADVIVALGYVRPDGKTLMGQPHLNADRLWTLDDIRKLEYEVKDPLRA